MSELNDEERETFRRLLNAFGQARAEFLIAGGQAARLYRLLPDAGSLDDPPLLTTDIDIVTRLKGHGVDEKVGERLLREGFSTEYRDTGTPPVTHYVRGATELEFIVPNLKERHSSGAIVELFGINAQKVDHLEVLLTEVVEVDVPDVGSVRVPAPAAYLIQKIITVTNRRELAKKGKDTLYIQDALRLFTQASRLAPALVDQARRIVPRLTSRQTLKLKENVEKLSSPRTDFVLEAARQAQGRRAPHSAEVIALVMKLGLKELLS